VLESYVLTLFYCDVDLGEGERLYDVLCPDWGTFRFHYGAAIEAYSRTGSRIDGCRFSVAGPRSQEVRFSMGHARQWGFRLKPLGWAALTEVPADRYANRLVDGDTDGAFAHFRPLHEMLADETVSPGVQLDRLIGFLAVIEPRTVPHEALIGAIGRALVDPELRTATDLAQAVEAHPRMVERVCRAAFGFSPKLLLRRQRFLRSIEQFTLSTTFKWVDAIDEAYHDQAQFVRDFRSFMGMTPREYAALDKPLTEPLMRERARLARQAMALRLAAG
jgi:AraC-like DNA-binding protein